MRAEFDYDPRSDDLIPCQQAGLGFSCGEVLQVVSKADPYWWQAKKEGADDTFAGLVPSPELQEWYPIDQLISTPSFCSVVNRMKHL